MLFFSAVAISLDEKKTHNDTRLKNGERCVSVSVVMLMLFFLQFPSLFPFFTWFLFVVVYVSISVCLCVNGETKTKYVFFSLLFVLRIYLVAYNNCGLYGECCNRHRNV